MARQGASNPKLRDGKSPIFETLTRAPAPSHGDIMQHGERLLHPPQVTVLVGAPIVG